MPETEYLEIFPGQNILGDIFDVLNDHKNKFKDFIFENSGVS